MSEVTLRLFCFSLLFVLMALWESLAPARQWIVGRRQHWQHNLGIMLLNTALLSLVVPMAATGVAVWAAKNNLGLLNLIHLPNWLSLVIALALLDMAIYWQHRWFHEWPLLWRLHQVHHADRDYDFTTGARFHPVEIILSMLIKMFIVVLIGAPLWSVIIFEIILNGAAMFNHGNIKLSPKWEPRVRSVWVTPEMHRIHHSQIRAECDSNYGFSVSLWDRLFGSYTAESSHGDAGIKIGLSYCQQLEQSNTLIGMLLLPWSQRP